MNKKRISIIGSVGIPVKYGGFETLAEQLSTGLSEKFVFTVFCTTLKYKASEREKVWNNVNRKFIPINANGFASIIYDIVSMLIAVKNSEILLILGGSAGFFLPFIKYFFPKKKIIFHPDGVEWKRKKWSKLTGLFLFNSIQKACAAADKIIIDNDELLSQYNKYSNKTALLQYGGDQFKLLHKKPNEPYWLTIARCEPENNLEMIIDSFAALKTEEWVLVTNYKNKFGKKLLQKIQGYSNIKIIREEYDITKLSQLLSSCKGYIHGHSSGGTNPSLVSSLFLSVPVLCHNNRFNVATTRNKAYYFSSVGELAYIIESEPKPNPELLEIAKTDFTWKKVCNDYLELLQNV
ncbi:MAG: DUF1972 domain-containing protein [Bacteroidales bacterium]|nr:DUF1972 domain-containing protein [Bacteroidales bacterium]MBN2819652.1 DUF1972 domain-containing protein [Bacteroidales bacterium]